MKKAFLTGVIVSAGLFLTACNGTNETVESGEEGGSSDGVIVEEESSIENEDQVEENEHASDEDFMNEEETREEIPVDKEESDDGSEQETTEAREESSIDTEGFEEEGSEQATTEEEPNEVKANTDKEDTAISESGMYDPEEVSGRESRDGEGKEVYPQALENIELPYIYENTILYNGTINPEQTIRIELPMVNSDNSRSVEPTVSEDGTFAVSFAVSELVAGEDLIVYVMGDGMSHEQQFRLPIQPEEEGMELVESGADTSDLEATIQEGTSIERNVNNDVTTYKVRTVENADAVFYGFDDDPVSNERQLEHISGSTFQAHFNELEPGQTIYFYIVASGATTTIEEQVPEE